MATVKLARMAMATRFEMVLHGDDPVRLRAIGEEAFRELASIEAQLSFYRPTSAVSKLNREAHHHPVRVDGRLFQLFVSVRDLWRATNGAFDPTVGPLMRLWGLSEDEGRVPKPHAVERARLQSGMDLVELDDESRTVRYRAPGVMVDFGGIGKGFALDEVTRLLREAGVTSALVHGGTSTASTVGLAQDGDLWRIAVGGPAAATALATENELDLETDRVATDRAGGEQRGAQTDDVLAIARLTDESLSVSDVGGKYFEADGKVYGHVIDPRTGRPADANILSAVAVKSATVADALSTALLVMSQPEREALRNRYTDGRMLVCARDRSLVLSDFTPIDQPMEHVA